MALTLAGSSTVREKVMFNLTNDWEYEMGGMDDCAQAGSAKPTITIEAHGNPDPCQIRTWFAYAPASVVDSMEELLSLFEAVEM